MRVCVVSIDTVRACPLATSVPPWTSHQTTVILIGFGHGRRSEVGVGSGARVHECNRATSIMHAQLGQSQQPICTAEN